MSSKESVSKDLLKLINRKRDYIPFFGTVLRLAVYFLLSLIFYLNLSMKNCLNSKNKITPTLKIYTEPSAGDRYIVSEVSGGYFRTVCNGFCQLKTDGTCQDQPVSHQRCLTLLNPGENCTNSSKPIGFNSGKEWYAVSVFQIPGCVNFNSS